MKSLPICIFLSAVLIGCSKPPVSMTGSTSSTGPSSNAKPSDVVQTFANAWNKHDINGAVACVYGAKPIPEGGDLFGKDAPTMTVENMKEDVSGSDAHVHAKVTMTLGKETKSNDEDIALKQEGGAWKIVGGDPKNLNDSVFITSLATALSNPEILAKARESAKKTACLSNVKQVGIALAMYMGDCDDVFPNAGDHQNQLNPYMKNPKLWTCPLDPEGTLSYSLNEKLATKSSASIAMPANTIALYEGKDGTPNFKHDGKAGIGFADTHAKMMSADDLKSASWVP